MPTPVRRHHPPNGAFDVPPSILTAKAGPPVLLTRRVVSHFEGVIDDVTERGVASSTAELSEAYERLGLAQFYYGNYRGALSNLTKAWNVRKKLPFARNNIRIAIGLGVAYYRIGEIDKADRTLAPIPALAVKAGITDLAAIAYGNLSVVYLANMKLKEALESAKRGLDLALRQHQQTSEPKNASSSTCDSEVAVAESSPLVLDVVRIIFTILIKSNEFAKADSLLSEYSFPEEERQLLQVGLFFASGKFKEAQQVLGEMKPAENETLLTGALVPFNQAVLNARSYQLPLTRHLLETTFKWLNRYFEIADVDGKQDGDVLDLFFNAQINSIPPVRSFEQSLKPIAMLSHIVAIRAEIELLILPFSCGVALQSGALLAGLTIPTLQAEGKSGVVAEAKAEAEEGEGGEGKDVVPHHLLDQVRLALGARHMRERLGSQEKISLLLTESSQLMITSPFAQRNDDESESSKMQAVVSAATEEKNLEDGDESAAVGLFDTLAASNRSTSCTAALDALDHADNYKRLAKLARMDLKKQYSIELSERGTKGAVGGAVAKTDLNSKVYCPTKHDAVSLTADLLPLMAHSGRNDIALWLQWAVMSSEGFGYGSMGSPFSFAKVATRKDDEKRIASSSLSSSSSGPAGAPVALLPSSNDVPKSSEALLKEVKARIYEVEAAMGNKFDGAESLYKPGDKESRVLLNAVLAKICFQLNLRRDCELAVETMEILTSDMKHYSQNMDHLYIAMARRFRFDLEEWKIPGGSSAEGQAAKLQALLIYAKSYSSSADKTSDAMLQRDALKKLINIYSDFSNIQYPEHAPDAYKALGDGVTTTFPPPNGTREMLAAFTTAEINEKEKSDPIWLRQFGRVRALQTLERLRGIHGS